MFGNCAAISNPDWRRRELFYRGISITCNVRCGEGKKYPHFSQSGIFLAMRVSDYSYSRSSKAGIMTE